jgi:uncharacterized phage protein (TIGR02218 family)
MKSATTAMKAHLSSDCTTLCRLYKITRSDGAVYTFTDHDKDISTVAYQAYITDGGGGYIYEAAAGFSPTAVQNKSDLSVDNQEATAFIDSVSLKEVDLRYGKWDSADVEIRIINWADLTQGEIKLRKGTTGNVTMKNGQLTVEVLGLTNKLQQVQGRSFGPQCDAELGDVRCKVTVPAENGSCHTNPSVGINDSHHITPYSGLSGASGGVTNVVLAGTFVVPNASGVGAVGQTGFGTVTSPAGTFTITDVASNGSTTTYTFVLLTGRAPVAGQSVVITGLSDGSNNGTWTISSVVATQFAVQSGYYDDGVMTFTSGGNSGLSFQIKSWDGITLYLYSALFVAVVDGDTFTISPGCDHSIATCKAKFNNVINFQGFPRMPGQDAILMYPDSTG